MEFDGEYLTYEEYLDLGGNLPEMSFYLLEFECRRQIDIRTFGRLVDLDKDSIPKEVKLCEFNLINTANNYLEATNKINGNLASESTDGYSVSYLTADKVKDIIKSKSEQIDSTIRTYLLNVVVNGEHLLYVGVR